MQTNVYLPQLELTMENVRVTTVRFNVGDWVAAAQTLVDVETGKAVLEVPSPQAGYLRKIFVKPDEQVAENSLLFILTDRADEPFEIPLCPSPSALASVERSPRAGGGPGLSVPAGKSDLTEGPIKAAPAARKVAKDLGLELATITGTGPDGRITVKDVQGAAGAVPPAATFDWAPLAPSRLALIAQMQKSLAEIPQFHVARRLHVGTLLMKTEGISFTVRLVRVAAGALVKHPSLRTVFAGHKIRVTPVSVAIAIDTPRGLVAPVVRDAASLTLDKIAAMTKDFRERAQNGTLRRDDLIDAPFAISNLGMLGVDFFNAFVFHGQTAVLGVGRAVDGHAWFSLAVDHRIVDGAEGARFLETLQQEILLR